MHHDGFLPKIFIRHINQLYAASRTKHSRKKELSVKTLLFLTFRRVLDTLRVEWWNSMPRFAPTPEQRNEKM